MTRHSTIHLPLRIAALYDIHGNLPALDAVLSDVRQLGVDLVVIGGDVFPGPMAFEALDRLLASDMPCWFIAGNGERAILEQRRGIEQRSLPAEARRVIEWTASRLDDERARVIESWPATTTVEASGLGRILFCHATPRSDTQIFTRATREERLRPAFTGVDADVVVCGHTHMQYDRRIDRLRVVNAGSVGMPFGEPGAYWVLLHAEVELRRTVYDLAGAAALVRETSYPQADSFAERHVLHPPAEADMLELYSKHELE